METNGKEQLGQVLDRCTVGATVGVDEKGRVHWAISGPVSAILGAIETMKIEIIHNAVLAAVQPHPEKEPEPLIVSPS